MPPMADDRPVLVLGGGPAGLMAADVISAAGVRVIVVDAMPSVGRKLLMAGRGGLNLTHSEPVGVFLTRYGAARDWMAGPVGAFAPDAARHFASHLGQETFVGSSGRVFPKAMKASPLLRAWLARLARQGVTVRTRCRVTAIEGADAVTIDTGGASERLEGRAVVLAFGGASWPRLGSDGSWVDMVRARGVGVADLAPFNAGAAIAWSETFASRFAGEPLKRIAIACAGGRVRGEAMVTRGGLEGGAVYQLNREILEEVGRAGKARLEIDLRPDLTFDDLLARLIRPRGKQSVSTWLRKAAALSPVAIGLLREVSPGGLPAAADDLAMLIKGLPLDASGLAGLSRAISTRGGVRLEDIGPDMQLAALPGVFVAGEMIDWDAPTGGYLLQGCFATGVVAGHGVLRHLGVVLATVQAENSQEKQIETERS